MGIAPAWFCTVVEGRLGVPALTRRCSFTQAAFRRRFVACMERSPKASRAATSRPPPVPPISATGAQRRVLGERDEPGPGDDGPRCRLLEPSFVPVPRDVVVLGEVGLSVDVGFGEGLAALTVSGLRARIAEEIPSTGS